MALATYILCEMSELLFATCVLFGFSLFISYNAAAYAVTISDLKTRRRNNMLFRDKQINRYRFYMWVNIIIASLVMYYSFDLIDVILTLE